MAFDLDGSLSGVAAWIYDGPFGGIVANPFAAALLLTCLSLVIVFAAVPSAEDAPWRQRARAAVYVFGASVLVLALHFYAVARRAQKEHSRGVASQIMGQIQGAQAISQPLRPMPSVFGRGEISERTERSERAEDRPDIAADDMGLAPVPLPSSSMGI